MTSVRIPPTKRSLRIASNIGADGDTSSLPHVTAASRYKVLKRDENKTSIHSVQDVEKHRTTTDRLLMKADRMHVRLAKDSLFLPTYYTTENSASPRTETGNSSARSRREENAPRGLPAIDTPRTAAKKWALRYTEPLPITDPLEALLADERAKNVTTSKPDQLHDQRSEMSSAGTSSTATPRSDGRPMLSRNTTNNADLTAIPQQPPSHTSHHHRRHKEHLPWWESEPLDDNNRAYCRKQLVDNKETVKMWLEDMEYLALDYVAMSPDAVVYDFAVEQEVGDALGNGVLKDLLEAMGAEQGVGQVPEGIDASAPTTVFGPEVDDDMIFHIDFRRTAGKSKMVVIEKAKTKALGYLEGHFQRISADLRDDLLGNH